MPSRVKYVFKIEGKYTVSTLPMERLAEYMADLAKMLGEPEKVHFVELVESSVGIVHAVEEEAAPAIDTRLENIDRGSADVVAMSAYRALDKRLREDASHAKLFPEGHSAKMLEFRGGLAPPPITVGGVPQTGNIDGTIIRVGGRREEIPVAVQSGDRIYAKCVANKPLAKRLAKYLFEGELRLFGHGKWSRDEDGHWALQRFVIADFEVLDTAPLTSVIADLRAIPGTEWAGTDDLWREAFEIRTGKPH